jgi:hypothetical protein
VTQKDKPSVLYLDAILSQRMRAQPHRRRERARPIATHKFAVGQAVYYSPGIFESAAQKGIYRVVRLLPAEGRDNQYRLKSESEGTERVVCESQLSAA